MFEWRQCITRPLVYEEDRDFFASHVTLYTRTNITYSSVKMSCLCLQKNRSKIELERNCTGEEFCAVTESPMVKNGRS